MPPKSTARSQKQGASPPAPPARPTRWVYEEEFLRHDSEWGDVLNKYGAQGWELIAVLHDESTGPDEPMQSRCIFKRPATTDVSEEDDADETGE